MYFKILNRFRSESLQIRSCTGRLSQKNDIGSKVKVAFVFFIDSLIHNVNKVLRCSCKPIQRQSRIFFLIFLANMLWKTSLELLAILLLMLGRSEMSLAVAATPWDPGKGSLLGNWVTKIEFKYFEENG
jgi:hypothetical protein